MVDRIKNDGLDASVITSQDTTTVANDDQLLVSDTSDSGNLKRISISDLPGGGGGSVDSVNGQTGIVVLDTDDIGEGATNLYFPEAPNDGNQYARANESWQQVDAGVTSIIAGTNITISPVNGVGAVTINAAGGGGGAVDSVNGQTGVVVLDTDDISEGATNLYFPEAPNDGNQYARQNESWQQVVSGTFSPAGTLTKTFATNEEFVLSLSRDIDFAPFVAATRDVTQTAVNTNKFESALITTGYTLDTGLQVGASGLEVDLTGGTYVGQYLVAVTNDSGQINSSSWTDINSATPSDSENGEFIGYAFGENGRQNIYIVKQTDGKRDIARDNAGTWEYNKNNDYASVTWQTATSNTLQQAVKDAMAVLAIDLSATSVGGGYSTSPAPNQTDIYITPDESLAFVVDSNGVVYQFDNQAGTYTGESFDSNPSGKTAGSLEFSPDGLSFVIGFSNGDVDEYSVSSPFSLGVSGANVASTGNSFNTGSSNLGLRYSVVDGLSIFALNTSPGRGIARYSLTNAYRISGTVTNTGERAALPTGAFSTGFDFNDDGTAFVNCDNSADAVYQYTVTTPDDFSSGVSYSGLSFSISASVPTPNGVSLRTKMYVTGSNEVRDYNPFTMTNMMSSSQLSSAGDADFPALTSNLDFVVILRTDDGGATPTSEAATINYDGAPVGQGAVLGTDFNYLLVSPREVKITVSIAGDYNFSFG
jgi:hypothetical protein